jgi:small subunit ribosomal protein S6
MLHYEVVIVTVPEYSDRAEEILAPYRTLVTTNGGEVTREEAWGRRQLAYRVKRGSKGGEKQGYTKDGCYFLLNFSLPNEHAIEDLDHMLAASAPVVRSLVTRTAAAVTEPSVVMAEQEKAKAAATEAKQ